jgi:transposase
MYSIGLDVHKRTISYCVKDAAGHVHQEGKIGSTRRELDAWVKALPQPPDDGHGSDDVHRVDLRSPASACGKGEGGASADAAGRSQRPKRKNDKIDAGKIADCLRCDFLPECHMTSTEIRDRRRTLRYRNLVLKQMVQMKNRVSGLLMETGVSYNKQRLHKLGYFTELMSGNDEVNENIRPLLKLSRETIVRSQRLDYALVSSLERDPLLAERLKRLRTIPGVGPITALTWALEIGDVSRFKSIKQAISYCGLCSAEKSSADKPDSNAHLQQRNKHIQQTLVEAAKLAPRYSHELALVYERERQRGNRNRATLAVARKMAAYMLAVERRKQNFVLTGEFSGTAAA